MRYSRVIGEGFIVGFEEEAKWILDDSIVYLRAGNLNPSPVVYNCPRQQSGSGKFKKIC
jgi:hypothetical protein